MNDMFLKRIDIHDPRLTRFVLHDEQSRDYAVPLPVDKTIWHDRTVTIYDPKPNPNQVIGDCTGCAKAMQFNARHNRVSGVRLNLEDADKLYYLETQIDQFPGQMPDQDTGSNGLASCKAAQQLGLGGGYSWFLGGIDQIITYLMDPYAKTVSVGTWWDNNMFNQDKNGVIRTGGGQAGGHQYILHGYNKKKDLVKGRCWWGDFRDFWIAREALGELIADDGDAHIQDRLVP